MDLNRRQAGVLLHITSLPGPHGMGDFGPQAFCFVDWLQSAGQTQLVGMIVERLLVREIAPVVVGLILFGRVGTRILIDLGEARPGGLGAMPRRHLWHWARHMTWLAVDFCRMHRLRPETIAAIGRNERGRTRGRTWALWIIAVTFVGVLIALSRL